MAVNPDTSPCGQAEPADMAVLYAELRRIAAWHMAAQSSGHTLQPTALVHEAWIRLGAHEPGRWESHRHFLNAAAEAMRHILVDAARRKRSVRNGGGIERVELSPDLEIALPADHERFLAVHEALDRLAVVEPALGEVVRLKFLVGLENCEVATAMGTSVRTVERQWTFAKAWLAREAKA